MDVLYKAFWSERVWLPPNTTWKDLENKPGDSVIKPQAADLWIALPVAVIIYAARYVVTHFVAVKLGALFNIFPSHVKVIITRDAALESYYKRNKRPTPADMESIASKSNLTFHHVSNWFRARRNLDKTSKLGRLQDSVWKLTYYSAVWFFGMYQFSSRDWVQDVRGCWNGFPNHHLDGEIKWFYLVQIGFYLMCTVTHFTDVRRTDFWAMLIHHLVTLGLMSASYINNHVRIGCLILITHDVADVNLELGKVITYFGYANASQYAFGLFVLCWIVTRLTYYPFVIVRTVMFDVPEILGTDYVFQRFFLLPLLGLLCLHIFWFSLIVRMVIIQLTRGRIEGDVRSDSELEPVDDTYETPKNGNRSEVQCKSKKAN